jgi:hypothetical protein
LETREYCQAEYDLVFEWAEKWLELIKLINNVTGNDEGSESPPPPTMSDEFQYESLRLWLSKHEEQFVPLWETFYKSLDWSSDASDKCRDLTYKYAQNPFLFFYEPENLFKLAHQMELQDGTLVWEPNEYMANLARPVFIRLGQLSIELIDWMDQRKSQGEDRDKITEIKGNN